MKAGALRSFEQTIWHHLDGLREAAWRREPDRQVWLYLYAPDPNHPWHRAHAKACGWVEGSTTFDQGVAAYTIAGDIAYDLNGKPVYQIVGNWFFAFGTNEPKMWADSDYETGGRRIPPWREEEIKANAAVIEKAEQFKGVLLTENADTSELCEWLRKQRDTPPHVLAAIATLDTERHIEASGTEHEKRKWYLAMGREG